MPCWAGCLEANPSLPAANLWASHSTSLCLVSPSVGWGSNAPASTDHREGERSPRTGVTAWNLVNATEGLERQWVRWLQRPARGRLGS